MTEVGLFPDLLVAGLEYRQDFISEDEERDLLGRLHDIDLAPFRFQGWTGNRKTRSYGWRYDFDDSTFRPAEPIPTWLEPLRDKASVLAGAEIAHALIARYDPGAGIGWHKDRGVFDRVVGISLLSPAVLRFRKRSPSGFARFNLPVDPRSAYILSGEARYEWEHRIVPGEELRFSITFRTMSEIGRRKAAAAQRSS
jgi:DNA oxidative demethylase